MSGRCSHAWGLVRDTEIVPGRFVLIGGECSGCGARFRLLSVSASPGGLVFDTDYLMPDGSDCDVATRREVEGLLNSSWAAAFGRVVVSSRSLDGVGVLRPGVGRARPRRRHHRGA